MVPEVSEHGQLAPYFRACGEEELTVEGQGGAKLLTSPQPDSRGTERGQ